MATADRILAELNDVTETGDGWKAKCPTHDDNSPSLSLSEADDGKVLMHCFAGCENKDIMEAIELPMSALFSTPVSVEYYYVDEHGDPLYMVRRYGSPKKFAQSRWDAESGEFVSGVKGVRRVPYHLPELLAGVAEGRIIHNCEGEKDVDRLRSHGLVATCNAGGAGKGEWSEWAPMFDGARVVLWPDNDDAGRKHMNMVANALLGHAKDLRIATLPVPAKGDVSDYMNFHTLEDLAALADAAPLVAVTTTEMAPTRAQTGSFTVQTNTGTSLTKTGCGYEITKAAGKEFYQVSISDFEFDLVSVIVMEDALLFEVAITCKQNKTCQVPSDLFSSMPRFKKWCQGRELEWSGDQAALDGLYSLLNHPNKEVPRRRGVSVVGLHRTEHGYTWVLPNETFGADPETIIYVEPQSGDLWSKGLNLIEDGNWQLEAIELLAKLHLPTVMTPILGWMAAAPLRSLCSQFPPLVVTGASGYGKTTILERVLSTFGYWILKAKSLGSATPYTIEAFCASTNAFPAWFDEYRGSKFGRVETRMAIQQAIRDSFDGASTPKGGGGDNHLGIIDLPKIAPLIISGEDSFTETSHIERALIINVPKYGRNTEALFSLIERDDEGFPIIWEQGFGSAYLEWLIGLPYEYLLPPVNTDRTKLGRQIAEWGYGLLTMFVNWKDPNISMPKFDYSLVSSDQREALSTNPIADAIAEAQGQTDEVGELIFDDEDEGYRCLRVGALVDWVNKNRADSITLPGGANAITKWLKTEYGAEKAQITYNLNRVRVMRWPIPEGE